jgi:hypothetical protein
LVRTLDIRQKSTNDFERADYQVRGYGGSSRRIKESASEKGVGFWKQENLSYRRGKEKKDEAVEKEIRITRETEDSIRKVRKEIAYGDISLPKKSWKFLAIFVLLILVIMLLAGAYLFLPKASVTVFSSTKSRSLDLEARADTRLGAPDLEGKSIPARSISFDEEISKNFDSTGSKGATNYKARGTITIYNEYSSANQPLVATTRFLSEGGKLFRLVSGVVVPGLTTVGSETKPGAVEAEVVADESGEEYNIEPAKFSIPGFQSSGEKYAKIYGRSGKPMAGGGKGGEQVKTVTQSDIDTAKKSLLTEAGSRLKEKAKSEFGQEFSVADDGINFGEPSYKISNSAGDIADNFSVSLKVNAKALAFNESDLKSLANDVLAKSAGEGRKVVENSINYEFGKTETDFVGESMKIKLHVAGKTIPAHDVEAIEKGILGKNEEEMMAYLKSFPDITSVEIDYFPDFISGKIPLYGSRVDIILDNN